MARKKGSSSKDFAVPPKGGNKSNIVQQNGNDNTVHQQAQHSGGGGKNNVASQLQALTDRMKAMEDRAERAEAKVEKLQEDSESAKKTMKASDQASKRTKARDADVDAHVLKLETEKNTLKERVSQLEGTVQGLQNGSAANFAERQRSKQDKAISALNNAVDSWTHRVARAEDSIEEMQERQEYHSADIATLEEKTDELERDCARMRKVLRTEIECWDEDVAWRNAKLVPGLRKLARRAGLNWSWSPVDMSGRQSD